MTVNPIQTPHAWSKDTLLAKSQRYAEEMESYTHGDWKFAFWSMLVLELLARAALAHISPVLLATVEQKNNNDQRSWHNMYYGLGFTPKVKQFVPSSIGIAEVFTRLGDILTNFPKEQVAFGTLHMSRRNEELHSGTTPFDSLKTSDWLTKYYQICKLLLQSMGNDLESFIGIDKASQAETMISASQDATAQSIKRIVAARKTIWEDQSKDDRQKLADKSTAWATTRRDGHEVKCPSCESSALIISGEASAPPKKSIENDLITEIQQYLPSKFECVACGLKISGFSNLSACGLGDTYKATFTYDATEYYQSNDEYDEYDEYEPDFNDP